jgi:hypothetical protein
MKTIIKLDIDERLTADGVELLEKRIAFVSDIVKIPLELQTIWRSHHGGAHVVLTAFRQGEYLPPIEVVLIQALLGSDWKRETFNYQRARGLTDAPTFWQLSDRWNVHYSEKLEEGTA